MEIENNTSKNAILNIIINKCAVLSSLDIERTDGSLPAKKRRINKLIPIIIITLLIAPILIVFGYNWILDKLQIPISSVNSMIGSIFGASMTFIIAYFITPKKKS
jgi:phosphate/sulfate permease